MDDLYSLVVCPGRRYHFLPQPIQYQLKNKSETSSKYPLMSKIRFKLRRFCLDSAKEMLMASQHVSPYNHYIKCVYNVQCTLYVVQLAT